MPTYDFQCRKCEHVFEWTRPFRSTALPACPVCKSKKTEKLIAPPAVHFKGGGWYKTDSNKPHVGTKKKEKSVETNTSEAKTPEKTLSPGPSIKPSSPTRPEAP